MFAKLHGRDFTMKDFDELEKNNDHTTATLHLVDRFGTKDHIQEMKDIHSAHHSGSGISDSDYDRRNKLQHKYYSRLLPTKPKNNHTWQPYAGQNNVNKQPFHHKTHLSGSYIGKTKMIRS